MNADLHRSDGIGVYVITGFLGSGKTTLLNHLVNDAGMQDTAVIINEFGEVGIDHALVESAFEDALLLSNGCLCCSIRGDLLDTLETLVVRRDMGQIPEFKRVLIETTGLADPAPIIESLTAEVVTGRGFSLRAIAATVDALHGGRQLDSRFETRKQAAIADLLLLTKTDLAAAEEAASLKRRLRALNPGACVLDVVGGVIAPEAIFTLDGFNPSAAEDWLGEAETHGHADDHDINRHGDDIRAIAIRRQGPLSWSAVRHWLRSLASLRGGDILRIKGILHLEGCAAPVAVHGIQSMLHPPQVLKGWGAEEPASRVVFIGRDLDAGGVEHALDKALAAHGIAAGEDAL
jgi:G3E family GTPase